MPPTSSAFDLYFAPKMLPMRIPIAERMNVVAPIKLMAGTILTCKNANVTPTASASMLVATASGSIVIKLNESLRFSASSRDSFIMLRPISTSSTNAIQWSNC